MFDSAQCVTLVLDWLLSAYRVFGYSNASMSEKVLITF